MLALGRILVTRMEAFQRLTVALREPLMSQTEALPIWVMVGTMKRISMDRTQATSWMNVPLIIIASVTSLAAMTPLVSVRCAVTTSPTYAS